jgi:hypothetical protein
MGELDPSDPLSTLATLQLLQQLADAAGPPTARLLCEQLAARLPPLLADPMTAAGALPAAARLLAQAATTLAAAPATSNGGAHSNGNAAGAHSNGNGVVGMDVDGEALEVGAARLLQHLASILDDR